ncbi:Uncharacterized membrane protein YckC, RDD family [Sphingobacterium nematocida]|uniref:Uncharacterized membrane protein YckC, RDD family n=1 Tax=Sphingobacterium nematocida TaxID=1513896 RepID=A0A1T5C6F6_9SPHI|nr:RDD family protein [Sphingobacterium nematocida]SKB54987.1 Uncharacterized membrane protein YckC, RDD family [Sphingobacterium nematocida]
MQDLDLENEHLFPSLMDRMQSSLIDTGIILLTLYTCGLFYDSIEAPDWLRAASLIFVFFLYEPVMQTMGGTVGNRIKRINVRKNEDFTKPINFFQALIRFVAKVFLGWISLLTIHGDIRKRAIHDMIAGTVMVNKQTNPARLPVPIYRDEQ